MAASKVIHGARAQVYAVDPNTGLNRIIGIFNSFSYATGLAVSEVALLGRFTAAELVYTGAETVNITASGYRALDHGPHVDGMVPLISQLLDHEYVQFSVRDRQTNRTLATIKNCRATGYSTGVNARALEEISFSYRGILIEDESGVNAETANATVLP
jgi:hypothetical protein